MHADRHFNAHVCAAGSIRAMPETEIPPRYAGGSLLYTENHAYMVRPLWCNCGKQQCVSEGGLLIRMLEDIAGCIIASVKIVYIYPS